MCGGRTPARSVEPVRAALEPIHPNLDPADLVPANSLTDTLGLCILPQDVARLGEEYLARPMSNTERLARTCN
jgi:hypothetical protein